MTLYRYYQLTFLLLLTCSINACTTVSNDAAATANIQLGMMYLQHNNMPDAKTCLLKAVHAAPHSAAAWYSFAYFEAKTGHVSQADFYYRKAIAIDPHSGAALNNYAVFLCQLGKYQAAMHAFLAAANCPNYIQVADAYENAGLCARQQQHINEAKIYFKKALANDPKRSSAWRALAALNNPAHNL